MKILVTGVTGQLGYDVCRVLEKRGIEHWGIGSVQLDITDDTAVSAYLSAFHPDAVIHCAAYTAVDKAKDERERCFAVNEGGTRNLARACKAIGAKLLYLSTDYVFPGGGEHFYETDDPTGPKNVYGASKLAGERAVVETLDKYFIVRTSWVYGSNGGNFVKTMLRLSEKRDAVQVVDDQIGSPTYTADLAPLLCNLTESKRYGIYHATNEGICSWAEFAREIFRISGEKTTVESIPTSGYPTPAARPLNSRLSKASLDAGGFARLPDWRDALKRFLDTEHS